MHHRTPRNLPKYFITKGTVVVLSEYEGKEYGRLSEGSHFGDTAILEAKLRTASIKAHSFCDLYELGAADMEVLLSGFPQDRRRVNRNANKFFDVKRTTVGQFNQKPGGDRPEKSGPSTTTPSIMEEGEEEGGEDVEGSFRVNNRS